MERARGPVGWIGASRAHLASVGEDYAQHRRFALGVGSALVAAGLACILHGLIPALFPDKASRTIRRLHDLIQRRDTPRPASSGTFGPFLVLALLALACAALPWLAGAKPLVAWPLSLLSLAFIPAYGLSAGRTEAAETLAPLSLKP